MTRLIGAAGEHYVAYVLLKMGLTVSLTRAGADAVDLLVGDVLSGQAASIQVKTARNARRNGKRQWPVGRKPLDKWATSKLVYALVDLNDQHKRHPEIFVVPVADIAQQAREKGFEEHKDWKTFYFELYESEEHSCATSKYRDKWCFLGLPARGGQPQTS